MSIVLQGMSRSMLFASIPDLRVRLNTDVEGISYAFALGSFGALVSTPLGAVADRYCSLSWNNFNTKYLILFEQF